MVFSSTDRIVRVDHLQRHLNALRLDEIPEGEQGLGEYVEDEARHLPTAQFAYLDKELFARVTTYSKSTEPLDKKAAIAAIDQLIDAKLPVENPSKISQMVESIRTVMSTCTDLKLLEKAADVMGKLVSAGGNLTAEVVNSEVKEALVQLAKPAHQISELRRLSACHMLRTLADNAPSVFNVHVLPFMERIWNALRDTRMGVREVAVRALRSCLKLVEKRETRYRVQWWYRLFDQTMVGLERPFNVRPHETEVYVHASLLALGELLEHSGEFMLARYKQTVDTVLTLRDSKHMNVKMQVMLLIPKMSAFAPEKFVVAYLDTCTQHLLNVMTREQPSLAIAAFTSFGQMLTPLAAPQSVTDLRTKMQQYLPEIEAQILEACSPKHQHAKQDHARRAMVLEAMSCAATLAEALGPMWEESVARLIKPIILTGLSVGLIQALMKISKHLPNTVPTVQQHLLLPVLAALPMPTSDSTLVHTSQRQREGSSWRHCYHVKAGLLRSSGMEDFARQVQSQVSSHLEEDGRQRKMVIVALDTLAEVDFGQHMLLGFTQDVLLSYACSEDEQVRKSAALAAWKVTERQWSVLRKLVYDGQGGRTESLQMCHFAVEHIVKQLLTMAAADMDPAVRRAIVERFLPAFLDDGGPDAVPDEEGLLMFFAQAESANALTLCLNDTNAHVRLASLTIMGKIARLNPAVSFPVLRRHLQQLLGDFSSSADSARLDETAVLLSAMIEQCPELVMPNLHTVQDKLANKLDQARARIKEHGGKSKSGHSMTDSIMQVISSLVSKATVLYRPFLPHVLESVIEAITDRWNDAKHLPAAIACLGNITGCTGYVIEPYINHPPLLPAMLELLDQTYPSSLHIQVVKVLGIIGALGPHTHKLIQAAATGEGKLEKDGVSGISEDDKKDDERTLVRFEPIPTQNLSHSEDFYPSTAINALLKQLCDMKMAPQHEEVITALMYIFKDLKLGSVTYLSVTMPVLLSVVRHSEEALQAFIVGEIIDLVRIVQAHMRPYLQELLDLIVDFWDIERPVLLKLMLNLLARLAVILQEDMRQHAGRLVPRFVHIFQEAARSGDYYATEPALQALEALGQSLETQFHTLLPALVRLLPAVNSSITPKETKRSILATMSALLPRMRLAPHASTILHPLICTIRNSKIPEVRVDAINTICNVSVAIGGSLSLFVPTIQSVISQANLPVPERWQRIIRTLAKNEAPCIADITTRWDDASGWAAEMDSVRYRTPLCAPPENPPTALNPRVSQENLRKAWESSHRCTKEDWTEWLRRLSVELLAHSSSPALRSCHQLARVQPSMARELFSVGFVSCWLEIDETSQRELVRSLEAALVSPSIPPEIVTALLNLAEFMEHNERPLPLDTRTLGALAEKCHAYAKALHYKELEYMTSPLTAVESLVHICNQLRLPDAAGGILRYTLAQVPGTHAADWYEKLSNFEEAQKHYKEQLEACERGSQSYWENLLGSMRCMSAIGDWDNLLRTCQNEWFRVDILKRQEMSTMAAHAAWHMSQWRHMGRYVDSMDASQMRENTSSESSLLRAVLAINRNKNSEDFGPAIAHIERTRELLSVELAALVGESYSRAYTDIVRAQQCTELMEVVEYTKAQNVVMRLSGKGNGSDSDSKVDDEVRRATEKMQLVREVWRTRLMGVERSVDVWTQLLAVRKLVVPPREDADIYTKYAVMCRKENRASNGWRTLVQLLGYDPTTVPKGQRGYGSNSGNPMVMLYCLKHLWEQKSMPPTEVIDRMSELLEELKESHDSANLVCTFHLPRFTLVSQHIQKTLPVNSNKSGAMNIQQPAWHIAEDSGSPVASRMPSSVPGVPNKIVSLQSLIPPNKPNLIAKAYFCKAQWTFVTNKEFSTELTDEINADFQAAAEHAPSWGKLWHKYGIFNMLVLRDWLGGVHASRRAPEECTHIIASAVKAFFKSVDMCGSGTRHETLQDVLRLLTLWYRYGNFEDVKVELNTGFKTVAVDTWLVAIPQMMARIHVDDGYIIDSLKELLVKIGRNHPQALMHPLLVATRSANTARQSNAQAVLNEIISHSPNLVRQTQTVSEELIRIAILWHEQWHEALEEASRLYFGEQDVEGMLHTLMPLHTKLNASMVNSPAMETKSEKYFKMTYGPDLAEAFKWCTKYQESRRDADLHQAWDLYYHIFRRINKNLPTVLSLDLKTVSSTLYSARDLELAVPGTYVAGEPVVSIQRFAQTLQVIQSKQRPRKLTVIGSNGCEYQFLLKGHEDLRQDERVMQLFGLVNNLLAEERNAADRDLSIARYAVIPLSPNSGLIGWVRNCDTMHALIREYRESRRIPLNAEHKIMQNVAPNYDQMMVIQKVEVFEDALDRTSGDDLHKVLWLKSRNSEMWLDRRTNYTRSTAVMSMAGYVLGLGDRHPSNLMLDRYSGKLVHIDFGDCFEASMTREKYPEKVPFRLTRMMTKAMEVCGTQGSFEKTCDITMAVLREEKVSVMAMLEAFVFDPLINWRLLQSRPAQATASHNPTAVGLQSTPSTTVDNASDSQAATHHTTTEHLSQFVAIAQAGAQAGVSKDLMDKAQDVMMRMLNKLEGKDFRSDKSAALKTLDQVQKLIQRATSNELLCQSYIGWCPFW